MTPKLASNPGKPGSPKRLVLKELCGTPGPRPDPKTAAFFVQVLLKSFTAHAKTTQQSRRDIGALNIRMVAFVAHYALQVDPRSVKTLNPKLHLRLGSLPPRTPKVAAWPGKQDTWQPELSGIRAYGSIRGPP